MTSPRRRRFCDLSRQEQGFVTVVVAIMMPLFLVCVALVVDVGTWYFKSIQVQRAADSAALAGVTKLPAIEAAKDAARAMAELNGYATEAGSRGTTVSAEAIKNSYTRLKVTIEDRSTPLFFGTTLFKNWTIKKSSVAEYVSNIPLGSKENSIGSADAASSADPGMVASGFWLSITGPCSPKEFGDQFASRYDGTWTVRSSQAYYKDLFPQVTGNDKKRRLAQICDYDESKKTTGLNGEDGNYKGKDPATVAAETDVTAGDRNYYQRLADQLAKARTLRNNDSAADPIFQGTALNREYTGSGYNYIINVPCTNSLQPPPCGKDDKFASDQDLVIQVFDPVFHPATLAEFYAAEESGRDRYGIDPGEETYYSMTECAAGYPVDKCFASLPQPAVGPPNPTPEKVRVDTQFLTYGPDQTPNDISNDPLLTPTADAAIFGSCMYLYDTTPIPISKGPANDPRCDSVPSAKDQWYTVATVPNGLRGNYRINVKTLTAPYSFGSNSFAIRAFFAPHNGVQTYYPCGHVNQPLCASVAGDSHMSIFVPTVAGNDAPRTLYLAKLAPASAYRGKTLVIRLWDPGEGGSNIQILQPNPGSDDLTACETANPAPPTKDASYCSIKFNWTIGKQGINKHYPDQVAALKYSTSASDEYDDPCLGSGVVNTYTLDISSNEEALDSATPQICKKSAMDTESFRRYKRNRFGPYETDGAGKGKFNDRLVNITFKVPARYGCDPNFVEPACKDMSTIAQDGWWKIRYEGVPGKKLSDRTTWTVELLGDPVHLVNDAN